MLFFFFPKSFPENFIIRKENLFMSSLLQVSRIKEIKIHINEMKVFQLFLLKNWRKRRKINFFLITSLLFLTSFILHSNLFKFWRTREKINDHIFWRFEGFIYLIFLSKIRQWLTVIIKENWLFSIHFVFIFIFI